MATIEQRARRAVASQGGAVQVVDGLTPEQLQSLAECVGEDGKATTETRWKYAAWLEDYHAAMKAVVDDAT